MPSGLLAGAQRLRIVDRDRAVQPWLSPTAAGSCATTARSSTTAQLRAELRGLGRRLRSESDTEVVLEAFLDWGEDAVAACAASSRSRSRNDPPDGSTWPATRRGEAAVLVAPRRRLHVASEVKALVPVGARCREVPPGAARLGGRPRAGASLAPYVDLLRLGDDRPPIEDPAEAAKLVRGWRSRTASGSGSTPT